MASGNDYSLSEDEVAEAVYSHTEYVREKQYEWERYRRAYNNEFWSSSHPWSRMLKEDGDPFPIKIESNRLFDYVQKFTANLLFRAPRAEISLPAVEEGESGRPSLVDDAAPSRVAALCNEWLKRSDVQEASTSVLQLALFHGGAAYKITPNRYAERVVDKLGVSVIPRWDVLWDDRETSLEQQLYRGHLRYERIDWVHEVLGEEVPLEYREELPGPYGDDDPDSSARSRPRKYCRVLEFYDMVTRQQRFYLAYGPRSGSPALKPMGEPKPFPYPLANGRPGIPIIPVVVANEPSRPLAGLSAIRRQYRFTAELNLMLTILANAMRKDAARLTFVPEGALSKEAWTSIRSGRDGEIIPIKMDQIKDLKALFFTMQLPQFSQHIDKYRGWLLEEGQATSGISNIQQGQQGKYLSATEAEFLANSGEIAATEVGARLVQSMSRLSEVALAAFAAHGKNFRVRLPDGTRVPLTRKDIDQPWVVDIEDAASTPMRLAKRQAGFLQVQKLIMDLVMVASAPDPEPAMPAAPGAAPVPAAPPVTEEMKVAARAQLAIIQTQWDLPDTMSWESISAQAELLRASAKPDEKKSELEARVRELLESKLGAQPLPPTNAPPEVP